MTIEEPLRPGVAGVDQTVARAIPEIRRLARNEFFRQKAREIVLHARGADFASESKAIWDFLTGLTQAPYRFDPFDVEDVAGGLSALVAKGRDCDDYAVLSAALFEALGYPTELDVVGRDRPPSGHEPRLHHVYVRVYDPRGQRWHSFDPVIDRPGRFVGKPGMELVSAVKRRYLVSGMGNWLTDLEKQASKAVQGATKAASFLNPVDDAARLFGKNTVVGKAARAVQEGERQVTRAVVHGATEAASRLNPVDQAARLFGKNTLVGKAARAVQAGEQEVTRLAERASPFALLARSPVAHKVVLVHAEPKPVGGGFQLKLDSGFVSGLQRLQHEPLLQRLFTAQLHEAAKHHAAQLHAFAAGKAPAVVPHPLAHVFRPPHHGAAPVYRLPVFDPVSGKWESIGLSLELSPAPAGLGDLGGLGNWFGDLVHNAIGTVNKLGYQIDPTRKNSPLRKALGAIPFYGPAIVGGADMIAQGRQAVIKATGKDPAAVIDNALEGAARKIGGATEQLARATMHQAESVRTPPVQAPTPIPVQTSALDYANVPPPVTPEIPDKHTGLKVGLAVGGAAVVGIGIFALTRRKKNPSRRRRRRASSKKKTASR